MATPIVVKPQEQSPVVVEGNASKTPINIITDMDYARVKSMIDSAIEGVEIDLTPVAKEESLLSAKEEIIEAVNSAQVDIDTSNLASKNLEEFFGVVADDSEEAITDEEITQELEDIFNTIFN